MRLHPEEPEAPAWESLDHDRLAERLRSLVPSDRQALLLVDGRSGAGKTTVARLLAEMVGGQVVHTDDVAWQHHAIDWADVLAEGILEPWRLGHPVAFRPPGWVSHERPGRIDVPPCDVLVVEGVGAGRGELAVLADLVVWVQSDRDEARRRGLDRDVELGRSYDEAVAFWDEWMLAEEPFLAVDRPWSRAALIVNGTPAAAEPGTTFVSTGPLIS